jgi:hypothetical protein
MTLVEGLKRIQLGAEPAVTFWLVMEKEEPSKSAVKIWPGPLMMSLRVGSWRRTMAGAANAMLPMVRRVVRVGSIIFDVLGFVSAMIVGCEYEQVQCG